MGFKGIKSVFSNRNILIVSTTQMIESFFQTIYQPFWTLFLIDELHFTIPMVALLTTVQRTENLLFALPGGFLADRIGRRKCTLISGTTRIISPLIYLAARSWEFVFLATILLAMRSLGTPAYSAMIAESLPRDRIATGYAVMNMFSRGPSLAGGAIGGVLMDSMGIGPGTRLCLVGSLIGGCIVVTARYFWLTETLIRTPGRGNIKQDIKELTPVLHGSLRTMMVSSIIFQISAGLASGLLVVYATEYPTGPGLSKTEYGLLTTIMSTVSFIMAIPGGTMADKYDRRKLMVFGRSLAPITTVAWIYSQNWYQILGMRLIQGIGEGISGAGGGMGGGGGRAGGTAWSSLLADLVPMEKRGRYNGLLSTLSGIAGLPAPSIGAWIWVTEGLGPESMLWTQLFIGLFSTSLLYAFLRDPRVLKKKVEEKPEPARDDGDEEKNDK